MKLPKRYLWLGVLAIAVIISLTLFLAPQNSKITSGSTYNRAPDGYGAWYAFMEKQGIPIKRWQKPLTELPGIKEKEIQKQMEKAVEISYSPGASASASRSPITLLRVNSQLGGEGLSKRELEWVEDGNNFVILGVRSPVTEAAFRSIQKSKFGGVKIETTRRYKKLEEGETQRLGDKFGAIVWQSEIGKGTVIYASTPYLGANAYQDEPGNYKFLAELVTENSKSILVDEYIHGYKDQEAIKKEGKGNWINYLANTPLASIFLQLGVILLILVLANTRRLGQPISLASPVVDNSEAYIQALAGVLQKANSNKFVMEVLAKAEQMELQKTLGLGTTPVENQTLIDAWVNHTGRSATELRELLEMPTKKYRVSDKDLLNWLDKWQKVR